MPYYLYNMRDFVPLPSYDDRRTGENMLKAAMAEWLRLGESRALIDNKLSLVDGDLKNLTEAVKELYVVSDAQGSSGVKGELDELLNQRREFERRRESIIAERDRLHIEFEDLFRCRVIRRGISEHLITWTIMDGPIEHPAVIMGWQGSVVTETEAPLTEYARREYEYLEQRRNNAPLTIRSPLLC